eukprot:313668-Rhodomonas_salina.1
MPSSTQPKHSAAPTLTRVRRKDHSRRSAVLTRRRSLRPGKADHVPASPACMRKRSAPNRKGQPMAWKGPYKCIAFSLSERPSRPLAAEKSSTMPTLKKNASLHCNGQGVTKCQMTSTNTAKVECACSKATQTFLVRLPSCPLAHRPSTLHPASRTIHEAWRTPSRAW